MKRIVMLGLLLCFGDKAALRADTEAFPGAGEASNIIFDAVLSDSCAALIKSAERLRVATGGDVIHCLRAVDRDAFRVSLDSARFLRHYGKDAWNSVVPYLGKAYGSAEAAISMHSLIYPLPCKPVAEHIRSYREALNLPDPLSVAKR